MKKLLEDMKKYFQSLSKKRVVVIYTNDWLINELDKVSSEIHQTRSNLIRIAIMEKLQKLEREKQKCNK